MRNTHNSRNKKKCRMAKKPALVKNRRVRMKKGQNRIILMNKVII